MASHRVIHSGGWYFTADFCRSANRFDFDPSRRDNNLGFRLVVRRRDA